MQILVRDPRSRPVRGIRHLGLLAVPTSLLEHTEAGPYLYRLAAAINDLGVGARQAALATADCETGLWVARHEQGRRSIVPGPRLGKHPAPAAEHANTRRATHAHETVVYARTAILGAGNSAALRRWPAWRGLAVSSWGAVVARSRQEAGHRLVP